MYNVFAPWYLLNAKRRARRAQQKKYEVLVLHALGPVLGYIKSLARYDDEFKGINFIQDFVRLTGNKEFIPVC